MKGRGRKEEMGEKMRERNGKQRRGSGGEKEWVTW
jgi:hypothetical protein